MEHALQISISSVHFHWKMPNGGGSFRARYELWVRWPFNPSPFFWGGGGGGGKKQKKKKKKK